MKMLRNDPQTDINVYFGLQISREMDSAAAKEHTVERKTLKFLSRLYPFIPLAMLSSEVSYLPPSFVFVQLNENWASNGNNTTQDIGNVRVHKKLKTSKFL
jgi:hypothetical protein